MKHMFHSVGLIVRSIMDLSIILRVICTSLLMFSVLDKFVRTKGFEIPENYLFIATIEQTARKIEYKRDANVIGVL